MKVCPVCNQTYADDNLNFCLNDGGTLTSYDDAPPTVLLNRTRTTQPNFDNFQPPSPWDNQPFNQSHPLQTVQQNQSNKTFQQNQGYNPVQMQSPNQTLPTIALVLGILSLIFGCCYGGIPLGAAAVVLGFLGLKNFNENPMQFGGRGLAIGGLVTGVIGLLISVGLFLIVIFS